MPGLQDDVNWTQVMFGINARHIPMWMVAQRSDEKITSFIGASRSTALFYNEQYLHTLILGELIVRPHIVVGSNDFMGHGISAFLTDNPSAEEWMRNGKVLVFSETGMVELNKWR